MKAAATCSKHSGGSYNITITPEANSSDASRQLAVQRLAAHDGDYSLLNMDTIWTAEFAAAGWLKPITGAARQAGAPGSASDRRPVGRVPGDAVRGAAEHQRAAAVVPQGPARVDRPAAPDDLGADHRRRQEAAGERRPDRGAGPAVRGLHRVVQQRPGLGGRRGRQRPGQAGARQARGRGGDDHQGRRRRRDAPIPRCRPIRRIRDASPSKPATPRSCSTGPTSTPPAGPTRRPAR